MENQTNGNTVGAVSSPKIEISHFLENEPPEEDDIK